MIKLLANSLIRWTTLMCGGFAVNMAWLSASREEKVAHLDSKEWLLVAVIYYIGALMGLVAKLILKVGELESK